MTCFYAARPGSGGWGKGEGKNHPTKVVCGMIKNFMIRRW